MIKVRHLRHKAALCCRVGRIPTTGDALADRNLFLVARSFEQEADAREAMLGTTPRPPCIRIVAAFDKLAPPCAFTRCCGMWCRRGCGALRADTIDRASFPRYVAPRSPDGAFSFARRCGRLTQGPFRRSSASFATSQRIGMASGMGKSPSRLSMCGFYCNSADASSATIDL